VDDASVAARRMWPLLEPVHIVTTPSDALRARSAADHAAEQASDLAAARPWQRLGAALTRELAAALAGRPA
jgi:hypothetical protein